MRMSMLAHSRRSAVTVDRKALRSVQCMQLRAVRPLQGCGLLPLLHGQPARYQFDMPSAGDIPVPAFCLSFTSDSKLL